MLPVLVALFLAIFPYLHSIYCTAWINDKIELHALLFSVSYTFNTYLYICTLCFTTYSPPSSAISADLHCFHQFSLPFSVFSSCNILPDYSLSLIVCKPFDICMYVLAVIRVSAQEVSLLCDCMRKEAASLTWVESSWKRISPSEGWSWRWTAVSHGRGFVIFWLLGWF